MGVRNGGRRGGAAGRWRRAAGRLRVGESGEASFGFPAREEALLGLDIFWRTERWLLPFSRSCPAKRPKNGDGLRLGPHHSRPAASRPADFKPRVRPRHTRQLGRP